MVRKTQKEANDAAEYQALLDRLKAVNDAVNEREIRIMQREARTSEAETNIDEVKAECSHVVVSVSYKERASLCENEVSTQRLQTKHLQSAIDSYFYRIPKFILLVQNVIDS